MTRGSAYGVRVCSAKTEAHFLVPALAPQVNIPQAKIVRNVTVDSASLPAGCSVFSTGANYTVTFNTRASTASCGAKAGNVHLVGASSSVIEFSLDIQSAKDLATLTLSGPAAVWFGVGLGAQVRSLESCQNEITTTAQTQPQCGVILRLSIPGTIPGG